MNYKEIEGNLITLAKEGKFDVIAHGANCFCRMKRGIAPQMAEAFGCDKFPLEDKKYEGDINKLGQIDFEVRMISTKGVVLTRQEGSLIGDFKDEPLVVVNAYTQYQWGTELKPFDYDAFTLCIKKMNHIFKGKRIGLPQIGSHLAGGDWQRIKTIIKYYLTDCDVTIVIFKP